MSETVKKIPKNEAVSSKETGENEISVVSRAASVLVCLSNGFNKLTDIANQCNIGKSTAHRVLKTLEKPGFVVYNSIKHRYYLGPLISQLNSNPDTSHAFLIDYAREEMEHLAEVSQETVSLNMLVGINLIRLHNIQSKNELRVVEGGKVVRHKYAGATIKVLLSQLEDNELPKVLHGLFGVSMKDDMLSVQSIYSELKQIRKQGYHVTVGESILGALAIAAPVQNYFFPVALTIIGPESRMIPIVPDLIRATKTCASAISEKISSRFNSSDSLDETEEEFDLIT